MRGRIHIVTLLLLISHNVAIKAQYVAPDSLRKIIATAKEDTVRIDAMNWLSFRHFQDLITYDSCQYWADKAFSLSKEINYKSGIGFALINFGNIASMKDDADKVKDFYQKAIQVMENGGNKGYLGVAYSNLALNYANNGNYDEAYRNLYKSMQIQKSTDFRFGLAHCHTIFGLTHFYTGDNENGFNSLENAIRMYKELKENVLLSACYFFRGGKSLRQGSSKSALDDFNAAGQAGAQLSKNGWINANYYWSLADFQKHQGDSIKLKINNGLATGFYKKAEANYKFALNYFTQSDSLTLCDVLYDIGVLYISSNDYINARDCLTRCNQIATLKNYKYIFRFSYHSLSLLDSITGNFSGAYTNIKKHILYNDSLAYEQNVIKAKRYKIELEVEQKEDEIRLLKVENNLNTAIASKQKQQKYFALAGIGMLALAGGYGFLHFRRRKKIQGQQELLKQQQRISRDLHDEIGATLSGIAMYSHLVKNNLENNQADAAKYSVDIIQSSATEMVTKLNDIIWLINPQKETLEDIFVKLREYAQNMCIAKNISPHIEVSGLVESYKLSIETRKNIYLFCKEAINNVAKYSNATMLKMSFLLHESLLKISICDDGNGFDVNTVKRGNGLENMQKRADDIGAHCQIHSAPQQGCTISLSLKITQRGIV